jgi:hypothetical protein
VPSEGTVPSEGKLMHIQFFPICRAWRKLDLSIEYYWQFIHRHVEINLNEGGTKFNWGKVQEDSLQQMKDTGSSDSLSYSTERPISLASWQLNGTAKGC